MSWLAVRVNAGDARDAALGALFELGSLGVQEVGDELVTHFPADVDASDVIGAVQRAVTPRGLKLDPAGQRRHRFPITRREAIQ